MERKILGGQTSYYTALYRYTDIGHKIKVQEDKYWTTYKTQKISDAKRMTGSLTNLNFRLSIWVNNAKLDNYFIDAGTKWGPQGYGAALEYQNKKIIKSEYLKIDRMF